jgi:YD repeat-containing protein
VSIIRILLGKYHPLGRLTEGSYSTGESFGYAYDAVGNRAVFTSTTPLSGTLVTTYTFDAANRLTARGVSDGRAYTYTWSDRGQLLKETTQGADVRTFTYDGAGRLVEATVFTLTTKFTYNGLGARTHVEVVGQGTTTVTLDYAGGNAILAETTLTGTVQYLYGHDCLGELRDDEPGLSGAEGWLYYQHDGDRMVRQGTDAGGEVVSTWLFDPDGTVLEGPQGPVSHLVCGGVYDWSTGLIYKGDRYFDPTLGIWLALTPLIVVQSLRRKKKGWQWPGTIALALFLVGMSGMLTGCGTGTPTPVPTAEEICTEVPTPTSPPVTLVPILTLIAPSTPFAGDFPSVEVIAEDINVQAAIDADWAAGVEDHRERSGWILWNVDTDTYKVVDKQTGGQIGVPLDPPPRDNHPWFWVGHYHIHPPLGRWAQRQKDRGLITVPDPPGPSPGDEKTANDYGSPGIVRTLRTYESASMDTALHFYGPRERSSSSQ